MRLEVDPAVGGKAKTARLLMREERGREMAHANGALPLTLTAQLTSAGVYRVLILEHKGDDSFYGHFGIHVTGAWVSRSPWSHCVRPSHESTAFTNATLSTWSRRRRR